MSQDMAQRIKTLRKEKGLTLEQVANIVGVGKSTVRKWETGMIANMKRDKIAALAKALDTTPAFLMGWKETEEKNLSPSEENLTEGEKLWLELYRKTPEQSRSMLQLLFETFGNIPESSQQMVLEMLRVVEKEKK
jgi:transcriptional regulator with XRE-family HTH domain